MAKNVEHVSHIKSKLKTNGLPQLPSPDKLVDGEIAVNYAEGVETISIRNENSAITTFSSDNYYTEKKLGSGFTGNNVTVTDVIAENEIIISNTLNYFNEKKLDASAYTPTDLSDYYTKSETSGASEIATALGNKVDTTEYAAFSAFTDISINDLSGQSQTIAAAFNDLNDRKLDVSAMTEVESAVSDLESIVGSGYTDTTITEVIENMDTAIAAALTDLDDKIGDIESILATI